MQTATLSGFEDTAVWDTERAFALLQKMGRADTKRTAERRLHELKLIPPALDENGLEDELGRKVNHLLLNWAVQRARAKRKLILFLQQYPLPSGTICVHANDARGARYWIPVPTSPQTGRRSEFLNAIIKLQEHVGKDIAIFPHGAITAYVRNADFGESISFVPSVYAPVPQIVGSKQKELDTTPHLKRLENESIQIIREAVAESHNPAMLYSIGKDSGVMLHLARKAFYPGPPPFPLLHIDTRWKFQEMYQLRDRMAEISGMNLLVHVNPEAIAKNINPFDHGSALHTRIAKTEALKQALGEHGFDVIFGGARRDEEKSRAKERIFSVRTSSHRWDPKRQRPELWDIYNTSKNRGDSIRVFPLSNWTELDIWQYILQENIPIVDLYIARKRPVVQRDGMLLMVDDDRFRLMPGEDIFEKVVRFRTLGCYPLTGAIESTATSISGIILELTKTRLSERQCRAIDADANASMERKKQEGYF